MLLLEHLHRYAVTEIVRLVRRAADQVIAIIIMVFGAPCTCK